jgi:hypothetical protein
MSGARQPLLSGEAARSTQNNRGSEEYRAIKGSLESALNLEDDANPGILGVFGNQAKMILFTNLNRMNLALHENHILTQEEANELYRLMSQFNIGASATNPTHLSPAGVNRFRLKFEESSEGTCYDINLFNLELIGAKNRQDIEGIISRINSAGEISNLSIDRIFSGEKSVAAMMRLCKTIEDFKVKEGGGDGFNCSKCVTFYERFPRLILHNGYPINFTTVQNLLSQPINTTIYSYNDFSDDIETLITRRAERAEAIKTRNKNIDGFLGNRFGTFGMGGNKRKRLSSRYKSKSKSKKTRRI